MDWARRPGWWICACECGKRRDVIERRLLSGEYIRQLRVEYACRQLSSSSTALAEIASAAGFSDQSHFSRTFKRQIGMTPSQYRAISRAR